MYEAAPLFLACEHAPCEFRCCWRARSDCSGSLFILRAISLQLFCDPAYRCISCSICSREFSAVSTPAAAAAAASCPVVPTSTIVPHDSTSVHVIHDPTLTSGLSSCRPKARLFRRDSATPLVVASGGSRAARNFRTSGCSHLIVTSRVASSPFLARAC